MYLAIIVLPLLGLIVSGFFWKKVGISGAQLVTCISIITTYLATVGFFFIGFNNILVLLPLIATSILGSICLVYLGIKIVISGAQSITHTNGHNKAVRQRMTVIQSKLASNVIVATTTIAVASSTVFHSTDIIAVDNYIRYTLPYISSSFIDVKSVDWTTFSSLDIPKLCNTVFSAVSYFLKYIPLCAYDSRPDSGSDLTLLYKGYNITYIDAFCLKTKFLNNSSLAHSIKNGVNALYLAKSELHSNMNIYTELLNILTVNGNIYIKKLCVLYYAMHIVHYILIVSASSQGTLLPQIKETSHLETGKTTRAKRKHDALDVNSNEYGSNPIPTLKVKEQNTGDMITIDVHVFIDHIYGVLLYEMNNLTCHNLHMLLQGTGYRHSIMVISIYGIVTNAIKLHNNRPVPANDINPSLFVVAMHNNYAGGWVRPFPNHLQASNLNYHVVTGGAPITRIDSGRSGRVCFFII